MCPFERTDGKIQEGEIRKFNESLQEEWEGAVEPEQG